MKMQEIQQRRQHAKPVEYKALSVSTEGVLVEKRTISGYAAIFGNRDEAGDIIVKGAFAKSIAERGPASSTNRKIILLWQHDMDNPLGRLTDLREDEKGLYFEAEVDQIPEGDRALAQLLSGTLNQFSIGYKYVWDKMEYEEATDSFICKEINLFEVSIVSLGCNELTGFAGMKSEQRESERNQLNRDIEAAIKAVPDAASQYKFRQLFAKTIALTEAQPPQALKEESKPQTVEINLSSIKLI